MQAVAAPQSSLQRARWPAARTRSPRLVLRASAAADGRLPGRLETVQVTLRKPLGLVLAERTAADGTVQVFVEEVVEGGNAQKSGQVRVGDVLTGCSATLLKSGKEGEFEREGYGKRPYDNWERVMFDARGKQFDTVMAAISSNSERWGIRDVVVEFERQQPGQPGGEGGAAGGGS